MLSLEQPRPDPAAAHRAGRAGEQGACGVLTERVERVLPGEPALDRYELLSRVALEADEDQPGVEEAVRVRTGVVGIGAPQDPLGFGHRSGERDMRGGRTVEPLVGVLRAPDDRLLAGHVEPVPGVQQQADPAYD